MTRRAKVSLLVAGSLFGAATLGFLVLVYIIYSAHARRYAKNSSNYLYIASRLRAGERGNAVDLSKINNGDWQFLCLVGAFNDPVDVLRTEAARRRISISQIDIVETPAFGIYPIEEGEGAISFVDATGRGRTMLVDGFERLIQQHGRACFGPGTKEISLPLRGIG